MTTEEEVAAILEGWVVTTCVQNGHFWTIAGFDPCGRNHSGSRADPIELAHDLARLVDPPPPIEIDPTPEPVQPTVLAEASAGVEAAPPASAPVAPHVNETPEPQHEDPAHVNEPAELQHDPAPVYPGMMVVPDQEGPLRGWLTKRITEIEEDRLAAADDPNARARQIWGFTTYTNLTRGGNDIPADVQAAYDEFLRVQPIIDRIEAYAKNLRRAAISVDLQMLKAMADQIEEGWP